MTRIPSSAVPTTPSAWHKLESAQQVDAQHSEVFRNAIRTIATDPEKVAAAAVRGGGSLADVWLQLPEEFRAEVADHVEQAMKDTEIDQTRADEMQNDPVMTSIVAIMNIQFTQLLVSANITKDERRKVNPATAADAYGQNQPDSDAQGQPGGGQADDDEAEESDN